MNLLDVAWRNVQRNTRRSVLSGVAIAVASMTMVLMFALVGGITQDMAQNIQDWVTGTVRVRHPAYEEAQVLNPLHLNLTDSAALVARLEADPAVSAVVPRISFGAALHRNGRNHKALGLGVDLAREEGFLGLSGLVTEGRLPEAGRQEALLGRSLAGELGLSLGDRFTLMTTTSQRSTNAMTFTVAGLADFKMPMYTSSLVLLPLDRVQRFLSLDDRSLEILVKTQPGTDLGALTRRWNGAWGSQTVEFRAWTEIPTTYSFVRFAETAYNFMGVLFFLLAASVIINTMMMVVFERRKEIGTLAALGMPPLRLIGLFLTEALLISGTGSLVGVLVGLAIGLPLQAIGIDFGAMMQGVDIEFSSILYPKVDFAVAAWTWILSMLVAGGASLIPSRLAAQVAPVVAMKE